MGDNVKPNEIICDLMFRYGYKARSFCDVLQHYSNVLASVNVDINMDDPITINKICCYRPSNLLHCKFYDQYFGIDVSLTHVHSTYNEDKFSNDTDCYTYLQCVIKRASRISIFMI